MRARLGWILFLLLVVSACTRDTKSDSTAARPGDPVKGRRIYLANCIACHNTDPAKDGSIGPAIKGSSQVLLETKVLTGRYPPGHTPTRKTLSMPVYSYLKSDIRHLAAYLATEPGKPAS